MPDAVLLETGKPPTVVRATGAQVTCQDPLCAGRFVASAWRPGRNQLLLTREDLSHAQTLLLWTLGTGAVREIARSDGLLAGGRSWVQPCAVRHDVAVCVAASAGSPPRLERIDLESGERKLLYDPNGGLRLKSLAVTPLRWRDADGREFAGQLIVPPNAAGTRVPLFITYYHCEGYLRGGVGDEWPLQALAASGIAALCINAPPAGTPFFAPRAYEIAASGVGAVIDKLAGDGLIDPAKVGMGGLSFGTETTMWLAMTTKRLAALSIASLIFEPSYYWFNGIAGRSVHDEMKRSWGLGSPDETPDAWRRLSPALSVGRITAPILMQLPEQEARLSIELYARLSLSTTPAELYAFPDEAHLKIQPRHKMAVYTRNLDWFRFWLQGSVDPDPAKATQYAR